MELEQLPTQEGDECVVRSARGDVLHRRLDIRTFIDDGVSGDQTRRFAGTDTKSHHTGTKIGSKKRFARRRALTPASLQPRAKKRHAHADEHAPDHALRDALRHLSLEPRPDLPAAHDPGNGPAHQVFRKRERLSLIHI